MESIFDSSFLNPTSTIRKFWQLHSTSSTCSHVHHDTHSSCHYLWPGQLLSGVPSAVSSQHRPHLTHKSDCGILLSKSPAVPHLTPMSFESSTGPTWLGFPLFILLHLISHSTVQLYLPHTFHLSTQLTPSSPLNLCTDVTFSLKSVLMILFKTTAYSSSLMFRIPLGLLIFFQTI